MVTDINVKLMSVESTMEVRRTTVEEPKRMATTEEKSKE